MGARASDAQLAEHKSNPAPKAGTFSSNERRRMCTISERKPGHRFQHLESNSAKRSALPGRPTPPGKGWRTYFAEDASDFFTAYAGVQTGEPGSAADGTAEQTRQGNERPNV